MWRTVNNTDVNYEDIERDLTSLSDRDQFLVGKWLSDVLHGQTHVPAHDGCMFDLEVAALRMRPNEKAALLRRLISSAEDHVRAEASRLMVGAIQKASTS